MAADTKSAPKQNSVSEIFKNMDYGPAPEADNVVKVNSSTLSNNIHNRIKDVTY